MPTFKLGPLTINLPSPYTQGHTCTAAEARVLNQELHSRLRYNLNRRKEALLENPDDKTVMFLINQYICNFSFDGADPVQAAAREIAINVVKQKIRSEGKFIKTYTKAELSHQAELLLKGKDGHRFLRLAKDKVNWIVEAAAEELKKESV